MTSSEPGEVAVVPHFRVKICGLTNLDDCLAAIGAGADALGFNFHPGSKRYVEPAHARRIIDALKSPPLKVGVFVTHDTKAIASIAGECRLDVIQLHGHQTDHALDDLSVAPIIMAFPIDPGTLSELIAQVRRMAAKYPTRLSMVLADSFAPGEFGGSGVTANWDAAATLAAADLIPPVVLAGGLNARNVAEAITRVRPFGVDVASGVESSPGRKDPGMLADFVKSAQTAFDSLTGRW
jgi:phosphoribosylanthranilate isomerase